MINQLVRVFISSTFTDMQQQRDALVLNTFPRLNHLYRQRGFIFSEVDLRWGVTEEDAQMRLMSVCFSEVDQCRPFFIGILGEHYGNELQSFPPALMEEHPWIKDHLGASATELEIQYGVFKTDSPPLAYFYMTQISSSASTKLRALKQLIRRASDGHNIFSCFYTTPEDLSEKVFRDFSKLLENTLPKRKTNRFNTINAAHEQLFLEQSRLYIAPRQHFLKLDSLLSAKSSRLLLCGDAGIGKTAFLINWLLHWQNRHKGFLKLSPLHWWQKCLKPFLFRSFLKPDILLVHFVESCPDGANWSEMLHQFIRDLNLEMGLEHSRPETKQQLIGVFVGLLKKAAVRRSVLLVIDGVDHLATGEQARYLPWLPHPLPEGVRLLISTGPGPLQNELVRRKYRKWTLPSMTPAHLQSFLQDYLEVFHRKKFEETFRRHFVNVPQAHNPLFSRVLIEELRVFGIYEELGEKVAYYLTSADAVALFDKVLARLEIDYPSAKVAEAFSLLAVARRGLTENELMSLLGGSQPLPKAYWIPLAQATGFFLRERQGFLMFTQASARSSVISRYGEKLIWARQKLATFFEAQALGERRDDELLHLYSEMGNWETLTNMISDPEWLSRVWSLREFELHSYWAQIEAHSPLRLSTCFAEVLEGPEQYESLLPVLIQLLENRSHPEQCKRLALHLISSDNSNGLQKLEAYAVLTRQAVQMGQLTRALELTGIRRQLAREQNQNRHFAAALTQTGSLYGRMGERDKAEECHNQAMAICKTLDDHAGMAVCLGNLALLNLEQPKKAMQFLNRQENICRQIGDLLGLLTCLGNKGAMMIKKGKDALALRYLDEAEALILILSRADAHQTSLGNRGLLAMYGGNYDEAGRLFGARIEMCKQQLNPHDEAEGCLQMALLSNYMQIFSDSLAWIDKAETCCPAGAGQLNAQITRFREMLRQN